ncbi:nuclear transport factor 2 family protein [Leucobacter luti]|uniref:nuclear transport factor 2 family protein n=1 Tax=Leucobacter luti TaxID=340320 RepID=UPI003D06CDA1
MSPRAVRGLTFDDYLALTALKARYFRAVDTQDWEALRQVYTPDARFSGFGFGIREGVDTLIAGLSEHLAGVRSQHLGANPEFAVRAPVALRGVWVARGVWAMRDELHFAPGHPSLAAPSAPDMRGIRGTGFYEDEYALTRRGWRISSSRLVRTRVEALGDGAPRELPLGARARGLDPAWLAPAPAPAAPGPAPAGPGQDAPSRP